MQDNKVIRLQRNIAGKNHIQVLGYFLKQGHFFGSLGETQFLMTARGIITYILFVIKSAVDTRVSHFLIALASAIGKLSRYVKRPFACSNSINRIVLAGTDQTGLHHTIRQLCLLGINLAVFQFG